MWLHCDQNFEGYYEMDYSEENWQNLGRALKANNEYLDDADRANIIHNLFMSAYVNGERYHDVADILSYLRIEKGYLPWKTVQKHVFDLLGVLDYRNTFYAISVRPIFILI